MDRPVLGPADTLFINPSQRMLHPGFVVTFGEILTRMGAAAFLTA